MSSEMISLKSRQAFRESMVGWVLREISDEFDSARIECDLSYQPPVSGQRRTLVEQYYHTVDWSDRVQVKRIIQVFESVLQRAEQSVRQATEHWKKAAEDDFEKLKWCIKKDGFEWKEGKLVTGIDLPLVESIKEIADSLDAQHLHDHIRRIQSSIETDPSQAIGSAKELIETCCKTILAERGKPVTGTPEMSQLTRDTLKVLRLVPEGIPDETRGADVIKRLLQNLGTIGNGLAELRGLYGTGHGKDGRTKGLSPRHAKLAVGAAATLAVFLFETHEETK